MYRSNAWPFRTPQQGLQKPYANSLPQGEISVDCALSTPSQQCRKNAAIGNLIARTRLFVHQMMQRLFVHAHRGSDARCIMRKARKKVQLRSLHTRRTPSQRIQSAAQKHSIIDLLRNSEWSCVTIVSDQLCVKFCCGHSNKMHCPSACIARPSNTHKKLPLTRCVVICIKWSTHRPFTARLLPDAFATGW